MSELRLHTACAALLAALAMGCIGGQTTVPTSGPARPEPGSIAVDPPVCKLAASFALKQRHLGQLERYVAWERSAGDEPTQGSTQVTIDLSPTPEDAPTCDGSAPVHVEISTDDGSIEFSGTGRLRGNTEATELELDPAPPLRSGRLDLGRRLMVMLEYEDGTSIHAEMVE